MNRRQKTTQDALLPKGATFLMHHYMRRSHSVFPPKTHYPPRATTGVRNTREWHFRQRDPLTLTFFLSGSPEQVELGGAGLIEKGMMNALLDQFTNKDQKDQT